MLHFERRFSLPDNQMLPDCRHSDETASPQNAEETERVLNLPAVMKSERNRLHTFRNWSEVECSRKLARYGFYVSIEGDCVRCAFCGLEICAFSSAQDVKVWHFQVARNNCPLLTGQESSDCDKETRYKTTHVHGISRECTVDAEANRPTERLLLLKSSPGDVASSRKTSPHASNSSSSSVCPPAVINSSSSLHSPGMINSLSPRCPAATINSSSSWTPPRESSPLLKSTSRSSAPEYLSPPSSSASNCHTIKSSPNQGHHGREETTHPTSSGSTQSMSPSSSTTTTTWTDIIRTARFPEMMSYQARLHSFKKWPLIKPTPKELARAGLFYGTKHKSPSSLIAAPATTVQTSSTSHKHAQPPAHVLKISAKQEKESSSQGHVLSCLSSAVSPKNWHDSVQCFWCGERIHRWQKTDDALLEHARLSPDCRYVIQLLGPQLHHDIITA